MADALPTAAQSRSPAARGWSRFFRNRAALAGAAVLLLLLSFVAGAELWLPHTPNALSESRFATPSTEHWLGTDANGRDVLARVCAGARISLTVGFAGAGVSLVIGVLWGACAGYASGRLDGFLMRTVDVLYSLPAIIFVIVLVAAFQEPVKAALEAMLGPSGGSAAGLVFLVLGLGGVSWLTMARIVRAQVRGLRSRPFVEAARAMGASHARILFRHILPNSAAVILVYLTLTIPAVVLGESFLSYLGLGIQPPQASLGSLIAEGAGQINPLSTQFWLLAGPGGMLVGLLLALGFLGDGLRDALDPAVA